MPFFKNEYFTFLKIMFKDKGLVRFGLGVFFGLSFSIAVILATIGIMDGFEFSLKSVLKNSMGDINVFSREGFFEFDQTIEEDLAHLKINNYTGLIQTEGFLISDQKSIGIMIKGVVPSEFYKVTNIKLELKENEVALGKVLLDSIKKKVGDEVVLAFASGNEEYSGLPMLKRLRVGQIVDHKIYQKDKRMLYINRDSLQSSLKLDKRINMISLNIPSDKSFNFFKNREKYIKKVREMSYSLRETLGFDFAVRPFWSEFSSLIEAVRVEKIIIGIILQLIVVISIFNVLAFVIYLNEKKIKEIFLLGALGMGKKRIYRGWIFVMTIMWFLASLNSLIFLSLFDFALRNLSFLKLPGEIYHLGSLSLSLDLFDYILVFTATYFWLQFLAWIGLRRLRNASLLTGLRKEFR